MGDSLIGFMGYARAGKDTACQQLGWARAAMADQLKADLAPLITAMGFDFEARKEAIRPFMVEYGRLGRSVSPEYWINRLTLPLGDVAITDVRYLSEVKWIQDRGGHVIRVTRPGCEAANAEERTSFGQIELAEQNGDLGPIHELWNDGSIDQLGRRTRVLVQALIGANCDF